MGGAGTIELVDQWTPARRVGLAVMLGSVTCLAAAAALFMTERAGGGDRWWWISASVVAMPVGLAALVAPKRQRLAVCVVVAALTVAIGVVLERRAPFPEDRVTRRFEEVALPSGYILGEPYFGDEAVGVGGYYVLADFDHPRNEPSEAAGELCESLRRQGWDMRCSYDLFSSDSADQDFAEGNHDYADLWGKDGRFRIAVELHRDTDGGIVIVKSDQPQFDIWPFPSSE